MKLRFPEVLTVICIAIVLAGLLLLVITSGNSGHIRTQCTSNLKHIGMMAELYRGNFGGKNYDLPRETGAAWHRKLIDLVSENKDTVIWQCGLEGSLKTWPDYRGPSKDINALLESSDPIAGDKFDNHGDPERYGVNALTKGYQVLKITKQDAARWAKFESGTSE